MGNGHRQPLFWGVALAVVALDFITKQVAVATLSSAPTSVLGQWLTLRLVYNPGAAFGIYVGESSRWIFMALALIALAVLATLARQTRPTQWTRLLALGLVCGGAVGNLVDRLRSARGVVDFIDVHIGSFHWPTFNVADMAVTCGALALAAVFWQEGRRGDEQQPAEQAGPAGV